MQVLTYLVHFLGCNYTLSMITLHSTDHTYDCECMLSVAVESTPNISNYLVLCYLLCHLLLLQNLLICWAYNVYMC
mgnify:CR=1 FL=1